MTRKPKTKTVTIRDVANESDVSIATVSLVLNSAPLARYIPEVTKERIHRAARKLGYRPNQLARSLRSNRNHTLGVIVFDVTDPYCTPILRGIEKSLFDASFLSIFTDAHNDPNRFDRYLEMLLQRQVEGLIVVANWMLVDIEFLADLARRSIPTVIIGRELQRDSVNSILTDDFSGAQMAIEHLYRLGHRKIAFIKGPKMLADTARRWKGVRAFAHSVGLEIDAQLVVELPDLREATSGFHAGCKATEALLKARKTFTAVMAFDDMTALGCIRTLMRAGVKVPQHCSVVGFDDVAPAAISTPAITTIRQPMEAMGIAAVEMIGTAIRNSAEHPREPAQRRRLMPELIIRESTSVRA